MQPMDQYTKSVELAPSVIVNAWVQFNRLSYVSDMVQFNFVSNIIALPKWQNWWSRLRL